MLPTSIAPNHCRVYSHQLRKFMTQPSNYYESVQSSLSYLKTKFLFKRGEIEVIESPSEFYDTLKKKITTAKKRVFIASLYLGSSEDELIKCVSDAMKNNKDLKVSFLIDGLRGTRETPAKCSASLLATLVRDYGNRVDTRLYRTPAYVGWKRLLIPKRYNEGIGLQHMKIYGFDDEVLLSGANLSNDYFTNRQDRYYLFKRKEFTDYYYSLHKTISALSYKVEYSNNNQKYKMFWPSDNLANEPIHGRRQFLKKSSLVISEFLNRPRKPNIPIDDLEKYPTTVYPVSQFTPLFKRGYDESTERPAVLKLINSMCSPLNEWFFTAGYFNMLPDIKKALFSCRAKAGTVITASPYANGFFESKGMSGSIPDAYLYLSKKFLKDVRKSGKSDTITLREWQRGVVNKPNGWSYHAKGIWITDSTDDSDKGYPVGTIIGSSNYTRRAYSLDLESNAIIVTKDEQLRENMQHELDNILKYTKPVNLEDFNNEAHRQVNTKVKVATAMLGKRL